MRGRECGGGAAELVGVARLQGEHLTGESHRAADERGGDSGAEFGEVGAGYGADVQQEPGQHDGMGLGLFIAKTLLERSGATVVLSNRRHPVQGAVIDVTWPRSQVDVSKR